MEIFYSQHRFLSVVKNNTYHLRKFFAFRKSHLCWPISVSSSLITIFMMTVSVTAQQPTNLVVNPSFENYIDCPTFTNIGTSNNTQDVLLNWRNPTQATPDYFNACNNNLNGIAGVPNNARGTMQPRSGDAYAGVITYIDDFPEWREYIQTEIQLEGGIEYDIQFYATLASNSAFRTKNLGAVVTNYPLSATQQYDRINIVPSHQEPSHISSGSWVPISFKFTAQSTGTHYLTIGDFSVDNSPQPTSILVDEFAFYYIDDVSVSAEGCCPDDLHIQDESYSSAYTFAANNTITVGPNVTVEPGANVTFIAGGEIIFLPGFEGDDFQAYIGSCPGQFQQRSIDFFPNVITPYPASPGVNDELCLMPSGGSHYSVQILSSWGGTLHYAASGPITQPLVCVWDGACNQPFPACLSSQVSDGVYYAIFTITGCDEPDAGFASYVHVIGSGSNMQGSDSSDVVYKSSLDSSYATIINNKRMEYGGDFEDEFKVAPNPTTGLIMVRLPSNRLFPWNIRIWDSVGNLVFVIEHTNLSLLNVDISNLSQGMYHLSAINGTEVLTGKIIKE